MRNEAGEEVTARPGVTIHAKGQENRGRLGVNQPAKPGVLISGGCAGSPSGS